MFSPDGSFHHETRVRFVDTDASGRIHYTAMFRYFEAAEIEFMRAVGLTYLPRSYDFPRVHVECDFLVAVGHDDFLRIEVCLTKLGRSSVRLEFRSFRSNELTAKGTVITACADRTTHKSIPIPPDVRALLEPIVTRENH